MLIVHIYIKKNLKKIIPASALARFCAIQVCVFATTFPLVYPHMITSAHMLVIGDISMGTSFPLSFDLLFLSQASRHNDDLVIPCTILYGSPLIYSYLYLSTVMSLL